MVTYKQHKNDNGIVVSLIRSDGWTVPFDPDNTDYQAYLKWISEGNTPEPPDNN